ncbi:hypothetical protein [Streptomyces sp. NPDC088254]
MRAAGPAHSATTIGQAQAEADEREHQEQEAQQVARKVGGWSSRSRA